MKWFKIIFHDYMDLKPDVNFRLLEDENQAKEFVKHMQDNWSGGTTQFGGRATKDEVIKFIEKYKISLDKLTLDNINNPEYY